jgi:hypothetical protein
MLRRRRHILLVVTALVAAAPSAHGAAITFNTALPVGKGEFILRQQLIVSQSSDTLGAIARDVTVIKGVSVVGYGAARGLAVFGVLPVVNIDREIGAMQSNTTGLADGTIFARQEIMRWDSPGRTVRIAPFAGLVVPTGDAGRTGDGSLDVFAGAIFTAATTDWVFDSQIKYVVNNQANGFERGDTASADVSLQYRLLPKVVSGSSGGFLFGVLEANITYLNENRLAGAIDPNSGGVQVFLSPGVQYAAKRWIAEAAVRIPVVNDLNGSALEPDYAIITSLRFNF